MTFCSFKEDRKLRIIELQVVLETLKVLSIFEAVIVCLSTVLLILSGQLTYSITDSHRENQSGRDLDYNYLKCPVTVCNG